VAAFAGAVDTLYARYASRDDGALREGLTPFPLRCYFNLEIAKTTRIEIQLLFDIHRKINYTTYISIKLEVS